ncbi:Repeat domain-containing protein [Alteromonadaceae bacterium Bs31]|nr:Repeat domain-containing protein [Alteromonadaceae bacterium Bs31]
MNRFKSLLLVPSLLFPALYANAAGPAEFASPSVISGSSNGGALGSTVGDLNNDGRAELVTAASSDSSDPHLRIYQWQESSNSFSIIDIYDPAGDMDRYGGDLAIGDVNGDGWSDIVVPESNNSNGAGKLAWFENPGGQLSGSWQVHIIDSWSGSASDSVEHMSEITVGDIDGNGKLDVAVRDVSHGVSIRFQTLDGSWQDRVFIAVSPREGLQLWNPDKDGDLDILLNGAWLETPSDVLKGSYALRSIGNAESWYPSSTTAVSISDYASQVEVADFNNDGRDDLVITNSEELRNDSSTVTKPQGLRVYLAPADVVNDKWQEVVLRDNYYSWHNCEVGDFNRDGKMDVISGISDVGKDNAPYGLYAFINDGNGTSFTMQKISDSNPIYQASAGDVDGDGDVDLLAPENWNSGKIYFYKNIVDGSTAPNPTPEPTPTNEPTPTPTPEPNPPAIPANVQVNEIK